MKVRSIFPLFLIIFLAGYAAAQEKPELFSKIEQTFKEKEPAWKIESVLQGQTFDPLHESITFRAGKQQAAIEISIWKRLKDAQEVFAGGVMAFDNIRGKQVIKRHIPNLGDENWMWTNPGSDAWPMIYIRSGSVYVTVYAPSVPIAKRFAQRVIERVTMAP